MVIQNRMFTTHNDISEGVRSDMIVLLNQHLANNSDLYSQAKQAHWNVKGKDFYQLHLLFDTLAGEIEPFSDEIAERITALGGMAFGTVRMAASSSQLLEFPDGAQDGMTFVRALAERYGQYSSALRAGIEQSAENDPTTSDLLTGISHVVDKHLYFLDAHLQG